MLCLTFVVPTVWEGRRPFFQSPRAAEYYNFLCDLLGMNIRNGMIVAAAAALCLGAVSAEAGSSQNCCGSSSKCRTCKSASGKCCTMNDNKPAEKTPAVVSGKLELYPQFASKYLPPRNVSVWLPDGYQIGEKCDVLYMHDGQMLFDADTTWNHQEWNVDEVMGQLIKEGKIRRCIVVAADNTNDRLNEYFPDKTVKYVAESERRDVDTKRFHGDAYLKFLVEELKPFIDAHYKPLTSREHTFIMGSSMGGLISLYAMCEYPQVFGGAACLSTHLSMRDLSLGRGSELWADAFRSYVEDKLPEIQGRLLYMDRGSLGLDGSYGPYQDCLDEVFRRNNWNKQHYLSLVFPGHEHMETYWAQRLDQPLLFLLGK